MKNSPDAIRQPIRVLLADDHPVVRQGSATILNSQKDIRIVAEAADGEETRALYDQLSPDVLLLDLRMLNRCPILNCRTEKLRFCGI
jgi:DNA-binding NarL/FixJ family response regulator